MIFRKKTRKSQNPQFYFNNHPVEITQEYTYLGVKLTPSGTFTTAKEHLRVKAMHAFFSIRKYTNIYKLPPKLASQIFNVMISPIPMYNSEVWGAYLKSDFDHFDLSLSLSLSLSPLPSPLSPLPSPLSNLVNL